MDLERLEALAKAADPQEWEAGLLPENVDPEHAWWGVGVKDDEMGFIAQVPAWEQDKAEFIAAANPQTVLQLIAALREAGRVLAAYGAGDEALLDLMGGET